MTAIGACEAAIHGAASNVLVNLASLDNRTLAEELHGKIVQVKKEAMLLVQRSVNTVEDRMSMK